MTVLVVAEAVVIAFLGILVIGLLRRNAELLSGTEVGDGAGGLETVRTGLVARDIAGVGLNGQVVGIRVHEAGRPTLLAFMSTSCATCNHFWKRFGDEETLTTLGDVRLIIVTYGDGYERPAGVAAVAPGGIPLVMSSIAWQTYGIPGSPYFVMISGETGLITAKDSAANWDGLLDLIGSNSGQL
jgi:hypothetical protein